MKIFKHEIDTLTHEEFMKETERYLYELGWLSRGENFSEIMSDKQIKEVDKRVNEAFTADFSFQGDIPYLSFYNLLGIRKKLVEDDDDALLGVVASPGKGKSSFAMTCARFIDKEFTVDRVIFNMDEFYEFLEYATGVLKKIKEERRQGKTPNNPLAGSCVILDEGVYMIFSGDAQSRIGKQSQKLFSIIRALNLIVIVNITNLKKINKGVIDDRLFASWRIKNKGAISFFSKKRLGKIRYKYNDLIFPTANFEERVGYIDKECKFWKDYEVKKAEFLENAVIGNE